MCDVAGVLVNSGNKKHLWASATGTKQVCDEAGPLSICIIQGMVTSHNRYIKPLLSILICHNIEHAMQYFIDTIPL